MKKFALEVKALYIKISKSNKKTKSLALVKKRKLEEKVRRDK